MSDWILIDWIQFASLLVQSAILLALFWFARKMLQIRRASQAQAEALQRPCLTLATMPRQHEEYEDATANMDDTFGGMALAVQEGKVVLQNIGSGPALNVRYEVHRVDPQQNAVVVRPSSRLPDIPANGSFVTAVTREALRGLEYEFVSSYESLSGQGYQSRITLNNLALSKSAFQNQRPVKRAKQEPARIQEAPAESLVGRVATVERGAGGAEHGNAQWLQPPADNGARRGFHPLRSLARWLQSPIR